MRKKRGLLTINLLREIKGTSTRFLSIAAISMLGVAFFCGLRATGPDMILTGDTYFDKQKLTDIEVMTSVGLTPDDIRALRDIPGVEAVVPGLSADALMQRENTGDTEMNIHLLSLPLKPVEQHPANPFKLPDYGIDPDPKAAVNLIEVTAGRLPLDDTEVALDDHLLQKTEISLGDEVVFQSNGGSVRLRVVGLIESPKYISSVERGNSAVGRGTSDGFAYASGTAISRLGTRLPLMASLTTRYSYADIVVRGAREESCFSDGYAKRVSDVSARIERYGDTKDATWYVGNRSANPSYEDYRQNTERIAAIGGVFPLIFYIVAALVTLTTMTRMVEEERVQIGTFKALGYSGRAIAGGYFLYALLATVFGSVIGSIVGFRLFPAAIANAYTAFYRMPDFTTPYRWDIAFSAVLFITLCTTGAAVGASLSTLHETPAAIMRPKAPKPGKRVFMERIGFIWNRLRFTSKVTIRNLFRYKKRFWMSVIGIAGSCALMLTGFGLEDSIFGIMDKQFGDVWLMQVQAFSYDAMSAGDWQELLQKRAGGITKSMLCRDRNMDIVDSAKGNRSVHLMMLEDPAKMDSLLRLRTVQGEPVPLSDDGAVVTKKLADLYGLKAGSEITLESGTSRYSLRVTGVAENYVMHYVFVTPAYYQKVTGEEPLYNGVFAQTPDTGKAAEDALAQSLLQDSRMYTVNFASGLKNTLHGSLDSLNYVVGVLIVCAALLAFVVMFNLTNINITERRRELATLRVLGFYDQELYSYVFRENNALAFIGAALGLIGGILLHKFVISTVEVDIVRFVQEISPLSYAYSFALTLLFSVTVNMFMRHSVRGIDMVESLKSAE